MRLDAKNLWMTMMAAGCVALAGCGSKKENATAVPMNNMEVVDGTATDAMTDLDGVQGEGAALALPANGADNAATPAAAAKNDNAPKPAADAPAPDAPASDAEVVSDQ